MGLVPRRPRRLPPLQSRRTRRSSSRRRAPSTSSTSPSARRTTRLSSRPLKAADYVDALTNAGPFTVFAPTNAAFEKLPKGTVESLVKPEKQEDLRTILKNHVAVSVYQVKDFKDGQVLGVANGKSVTLHVKDGKVTVNDANIVASVPASNGIVHVVDTVIVPK